jgi:ribosome-binding protein aMBF1 (putative translation factor)
MRSKVAERILANTPEDVKIFTDLYADLVVRINTVLREKGINQKTLTERLDIGPSEIHKWLSGDHDFNLRSIAKLQAELGETLLEVPQTPKHCGFVSPQVGTNSKKLSNS